MSSSDQLLILCLVLHLSVSFAARVLGSRLGGAGPWSVTRILVLFALALAAAALVTMVGRPPRAEWAHLHSFESAWQNYFFPASAGFGANVIVAGIGMHRRIPVWAAVPVAAFIGFVVHVAFALGMVIFI